MSQDPAPTTPDDRRDSDRPATGRPDRPLMPYHEVTEPGFGDKALSFETEQIRGGLILRGACPRCDDLMEFPHVDKVYKGRLLPRRRQSGASGGTLPMMCTCDGEHPGRPSGEDGCGAYWNITLEISGP